MVAIPDSDGAISAHTAALVLRAAGGARRQIFETDG